MQAPTKYELVINTQDLTHTDLSTTFTRRYVVEVPAQLSDEEWEKKYSLPAPALKSVQ